MVVLSIIIPIYNTRKYIEDCVISLFRQNIETTYFEVLLIDDGSTDDSLSMANKLANKYSNIRVFHQENQGQAAARNLGIENAKGEYIAFVDSDDYLLLNGLDKLYKHAKEYNLDAVFGHWLAERSNGEKIKLNARQMKADMLYSGEELALNYPVFGSVCGALFKREVFDDLRFRLGFTHEDAELCFRLYPKLERVMYIDEPVYFYRYNPVSTDRSRDKSKLLKNLDSDSKIASLLIEYADNGLFKGEICLKYRQIANSMILSYFVRLRNSGLLRDIDFEKKKSEWIRMNVYPIKGRCLSLKSTIVAHLLNLPFVLRQYLR